MTDNEQIQKIREGAYFRWEQAGRPEGDGCHFWLESEQDFLKQQEASSECCSEIQQAACESPTAETSAEFLEPEKVPVGADPADDGFAQDGRTTRRSRRRSPK